MGLVYLPHNLPYESTIHVGKYTISMDPGHGTLSRVISPHLPISKAIYRDPSSPHWSYELWKKHLVDPWTEVSEAEANLRTGGLRLGGFLLVRSFPTLRIMGCRPLRKTHIQSLLLGYIRYSDVFVDAFEGFFFLRQWPWLVFHMFFWQLQSSMLFAFFWDPIFLSEEPIFFCSDVSLCSVHVRYFVHSSTLSQMFQVGNVYLHFPLNVAIKFFTFMYR